MAFAPDFGRKPARMPLHTQVTPLDRMSVKQSSQAWSYIKGWLGAKDVRQETVGSVLSKDEDIPRLVFVCRRFANTT
jgi:hypothetical protein